MTHQPDPVFPQSVYDLQRKFVNHLLGLRGYAPGSREPEPRFDRFTITQRYVSIGDEVSIEEDFPSIPLAAYIDNIPMEIRYQPSITPSETVRITLVVPGGSRGGPVRLVWASKILISTTPIWISSENLDLMQFEAQLGGDLIIGRFPERPLEVHIGWKEVPEKDINWENTVLSVTVPKDASPGPILVVTSTKVYKGRANFSPLKKT